MNKQWFKRLAALAALAALLCALLTGCNTPTQEPQEGTGGGQEANWLETIYDAQAGTGKLSIYFINATKDYVTDSSVTHAGDSTLLVSPDGKTMLVDLNNAANGSEIVAALQRLGIDTLDYLVLSHPHADHIGSYATLLRYIDVRQVIKNGHDYSESSSVYTAMMKAFAQNNIPVTIAKEGDEFMLGSEVKMTVMNPPEDYAFDDTTFVSNSGSLLLRFTYGQSSYLTGGDIYAAHEQVLVEKYGDALQSDVYKINHHGYDTSSTREWVNAVNCKLAICEANGVNSDVVEGRYRVKGATTMYTCLDGTIVVRTTGDGTYEVQTEYERKFDNYGLLSEKDGYENGHFVVG